MRQIITIPASVNIGGFEMTSQTFDMEESSPLTGEVDTIIYGHPRWRVVLSAPENMNLDEASFWEYVLLSLKGKANRLAVFDPVRFAPRGTMRGSPQLAASVAAGATSIQITASGQGSTTLKRGDNLQIGTGLGTSQLVKVSDDVTLSSGGTGTVSFNHYLRKGFNAGTQVVWDRPVAYFASMSQPTGWKYQTNAPLVSGFSFDLMEQWS